MKPIIKSRKYDRDFEWWEFACVENLAVATGLVVGGSVSFAKDPYDDCGVATVRVPLTLALDRINRENGGDVCLLLQEQVSCLRDWETLDWNDFVFRYIYGENGLDFPEME